MAAIPCRGSEFTSANLPIASANASLTRCVLPRGPAGSMFRPLVTASLLLVLNLLPLCITGARAESGGIYIYKQQDGSRLFTDEKKPRRGNVFLGYYGRPAAYSSCSKLTPAAFKTRADSYQYLIGKHAAAHKVPAELVKAVMHVESCFDRRAVSRVGARGLMQLMPDTASMLGVENSFDAEQNIAGGTRYLAMMREKYPQNWRLVLAAYNAGPGAVAKYGAIPPYPETQNYVQRVMTLYEKSVASAQKDKAAMAAAESLSGSAAAPTQ